MYPVQSTLTQGTHHCLSPSTSYDALTTRCRTQGKSYVAEARLTPLSSARGTSFLVLRTSHATRQDLDLIIIVASLVPATVDRPWPTSRLDRPLRTDCSRCWRRSELALRPVPDLWSGPLWNSHRARV